MGEQKPRDLNRDDSGIVAPGSDQTNDDSISLDGVECEQPLISTKQKGSDENVAVDPMLVKYSKDSQKVSLRRRKKKYFTWLCFVSDFGSFSCVDWCWCTLV